MKFVEIVEEFQKLEENKGKVLLARCGIFMVAIGKDAIFLNKVLKLNVTCIKPGICKAGIPVSHTFKYTDLMESMGYSYVIYDYDSKNKKFERLKEIVIQKKLNVWIAKIANIIKNRVHLIIYTFLMF